MGFNFKDYAQNYLNKRDPATGMYYTQDQIAALTGAPASTLKNYFDYSGQLNSNYSGGLTNNDILSAYSSGVTPNWNLDPGGVSYSALANAPQLLGGAFDQQPNSPFRTAPPATSPAPLVNESAAPGAAVRRPTPLQGFGNQYEYDENIPGYVPPWIPYPGWPGGGGMGISVGLGGGGGGGNTGVVTQPPAGRNPSTLTQSSGGAQDRNAPVVSAPPVWMGPPYNPGVATPQPRTPAQRNDTSGGSRSITDAAVAIPAAVNALGSGMSTGLTVGGPNGKSINPNAQFGLQMTLNQLGYMEAPMANAAAQLYNNSIPYLQNYFQGNNPGQYVGLTGDMLNQMLTNPGFASLLGQQAGNQNAAAQLVGGSGSGQYGLTDFFSQLLSGGLPNQQAIQNIVPGQLASANQLTGTVNPILQQILMQGLPGQQTIQNLTNTAANEYTTGGLPPEYVRAMRELVLQPSQEMLQGQLNRQGGGVTQVPQINQQGLMTDSGSGLFAELMRRNERDFNNQILAQGLQQKQAAGQLANQGFSNVASSAAPYFGMAQGGGNQAIQNALSSYGIVPQSVAPFTSQAGNLAGNLGQLGLGNYGAYSGTLSNAAGQYGNIAQMLQGGALGLGSLLNQNYLGNLGVSGDLARTGLSGDYDLARTLQLLNSENSVAKTQAIGQILAMIAAGFGG